MRILKSLIVLLSILVTTIVLVSCENKVFDLFISKYFENGYISKNMIELYNPKDTEVDLQEYSLFIYRNGSEIEKREIKLEGKISPKGFLLIANSTELFDQNVEVFKDKNKIIKEELKFNGDDPIAVAKGKEIIDTIGQIGATYEFGANSTLVRNKDINYATKKYSLDKFIEFKPYYFDSLSKLDENADIKIVEKGPRFDPETLKKDFFVEKDGSRFGNGGSIKVNLVSKVDGDTSNFSIHESSLTSENNKKLLADGTMRTRYYYVNTPESTPKGGIQAYGKWATLLTNEMLDRAVKNDSLYIQSVDNDSLYDTYNRTLGIVWADGYLVNWLLVRDSLSPYRHVSRESNYDGIGVNLHYKNILLRYYLKYAEYLADKDNIRINNVNDYDPMLIYKKEGNQFKSDYEKYFIPTYKKYLYFDKENNK